MIQTIKKFFEKVFRGYGQLFLCNHAGSGALVFLGMVLCSPPNAFYSLIAAIVVTLTATLLSKNLTHLRTGLFGANGALLGYLWIILPEVADVVKLITTILVAILASLIIIPIAKYVEKSSAKIPVFSLPYVFLAWLILISLSKIGFYDTNQWKGWHYLFQGQPQQAEDCFRKTAFSTPEAKAYQLNGLGWTHFKQAQYNEASLFFKKSIESSSHLINSYDGLGWSQLKQNKLDLAEKAFVEATSRNPFLASSWDGLGWVQLQKGHNNSAQGSFLRAITLAPFFSDAYRGLNLTSLATAFQGFPQPLMSFFHLSGWILFIMAVFLHSRVSGKIALFGLTLGIFASWLLRISFEWHFSIVYHYNILATSVALGGHYLVLNRRVFLWLGLVVVGMAFFWGGLGDYFAESGMPLLVLPFNIFVIVSLVAFSVFKKYTPRIQTVPFDVAISTPEKTWLWYEKKKTATQCWKMIESSCHSPD